ncbi:MAG: M20 family metallopeptidase [bacterium]|nr:M20 family metallopeptidase [bacterium]
MKNKSVLKWIENNTGTLIKLSDDIWHFAEVGLQETQSAEAIIKMLLEQGFSVERGVAGMPTAFVASYGSGKPVIGIMGEYDALPGLSQTAHFEKVPVKSGAPGHGCGHNLLGVGALGAALAIKNACVEQKLPGTIRYYGCPAEETLVGKVFMVRDGLFKDVDIALTWHPGATNNLWAASSLSLNSVKFTFHGRTSHAAGDPENGRSALDAVELMNIGANYLREHVVQEARIHYVITNGGGEPNIVPALAQVWYYVRAPRRKQVEEIYERLKNIAEGAALMTDTTFDIEFLSGCYNTLHNDIIGDVLLESMREVGPPPFDDVDQAFARGMVQNYPVGHYEKMVDRIKRKFNLDVNGKCLMDEISYLNDKNEVSAGSTDVGDVSWVVPTAQFTTACSVLGTPGHSWQYAAASGMSIGHKGMIIAAKVLALTGLRFMTDSQLVEKAKEDFKCSTTGKEYVSPLPKGHLPPLHQLPHH